MTLFSNYFYRSLLSIIILLLLYYYFYIYFFPFIYLFISYFKFLFVPFFFIFVVFCRFSLLLYVKWVHHMFHLHVIIFSFIPTGLLKILREERQDHPNYRQNSSRFSLCCCIIIHVGLELHGQFYTLFLSTLRYLTH